MLLVPLPFWYPQASCLHRCGCPPLPYMIARVLPDGLSLPGKPPWGTNPLPCAELNNQHRQRLSLINARPSLGWRPHKQEQPVGAWSMSGSSWELCTLRVLPWPLPSLLQFFMDGGCPCLRVMPLELSHDISWHIFACGLVSTSSVQQNCRKIKSQADGMVMFWTSVFALDRDDVNSASSDAWSVGLLTLCVPATFSFCYRERVCNHSVLRVISTISRKANWYGNFCGS